MDCKYCLIPVGNYGIYPCKCTTPVHKACLSRWLEEIPLSEAHIQEEILCEICHAPLEGITIKRNNAVLFNKNILFIAIFLACINLLLVFLYGLDTHFAFIGIFVAIYTLFTVSMFGHIFMWQRMQYNPWNTFTIEFD